MLECHGLSKITGNAGNFLNTMQYSPLTVSPAIWRSAPEGDLLSRTRQCMVIVIPHESTEAHT